MEIETKKGVLKYEMPSVGECFDILQLVDSCSHEGNLKILAMKRQILEQFSHLIDHKSVGYKSFGELGKDAENMALPMSEVAEQIYLYVIKAFTIDKKK